MISNKKGSDLALRQARNFLLERGELPNGLVQDLVARSWQRSLKAGLAPSGRLAEVPHLNSFELARNVDRQQELIANARPVMEYLHSQTRDSDCMVILADERGVLLQALGDADFLSRAERVALTPGHSWHEQYRGTNAIGTALAEAAPVVVHGAEHYLERNGFVTCAATPIAAPDGRLLGVLDISCEQRNGHPHTFGLVRAAGQMIENRLFETRHGNRLRLRFHPLAEGIGTVAEGVAAIAEDGCIVGVNQAGLALLGIKAADLGIMPLENLFDLRVEDILNWSASSTQQIHLVNRARGGRLFLRVEAGRRPIHISTRSSQPVNATTDALSALDTGDSQMHAVIERGRKVANKPIPLLLQGESGVGKELFANAFHQTSARREQPFVAVNCAALPENLIEAELFGYAPGAFTGALREGAIGRIREAHGGTLFLDEIGDMPLPLQSRLLRVLQERQVTPLGGGRAVAVDFSLICATHRQLKSEMEAGRFRTDLYYRINGLTLVLPCLRERSDFNSLVAKLINEFSPARDITLAPSLASAFADYHWPGNLRQLANALRTACALLDDDETTINWQHLPDDLTTELHPQKIQLTTRPVMKTEYAADNLRSLSHAAIHRAIAAVQGNMSEAARRLGISRNTLYRKIKQQSDRQ